MTSFIDELEKIGSSTFQEKPKPFHEQQFGNIPVTRARLKQMAKNVGVAGLGMLGGMAAGKLISLAIAPKLVPVNQKIMYGVMSGLGAAAALARKAMMAESNRLLDKADEESK